ncbi:arginine--tRNA ligase [Candidatus Dojkabacteria bacterium]|nr:arginine--tRNA ligase [Candidatus Dojkabacteria bacterium]
MEFKLSPDIIKRFPDLCEYIVIARGLNNEIPGKWINDRIDKTYSNLKNDNNDILKESRFSVWSDVISKLAQNAGLKSDKFKSSHIALIKRIIKGQRLPNINPVVNLYNWYSLKYGLPFGGEDLAQVYGDLELRFSDGNDKYVGIASSKIEIPSKGEIVWVDKHSVTCRMWNWRQSDRTKITKKTKDAYFIIETFSSIDGVNVEKVVKDFSSDLESKFGATVEISVLNKDNLSIEIDYETKDVNDIDIEENLKKTLSDKENINPVGAKHDFLKRKVQSMGLIDETQFQSRIHNLIMSRINEFLIKNQVEGVANISLATSQNPQFGDFSCNVAMLLAGDLKKAPREIASDIVEFIDGEKELINTFASISVAPNGFINFSLNNEFIIKELNDALEKGEKYGDSSVGKDKNMLVESPSINPNAPAHVGHLLNLFIGRALTRLFSKTGFNVDVDNLINDRGIKICQAMWAIKNFSKGKTPEDEGLKSDHFVGKYYRIGIKHYKSEEKDKKEMDQMLIDWESGVPEVMELWKKVIKWAFDGHVSTLSRLDEERGHLWLESDVYKKGKDIILNHLGNGVIEKLPDGAVIGRLKEKYGVDDVILLRSDGTSLYHTQDIFLTLQKIDKFNPWKAIWVVGNEQISHFHKLFALLDSLKILSVDRVYHFAYGMVVGKDGKKVSSRSGDTTADSFLDMMHAAALEVMKKRKSNIKLSAEQEESIAEDVGIGALRYQFLSKDPYKNIVFDKDEALSFTGKSGPYVMYSYSRARNVLRNVLESGFNEKNINNVARLSSDVSSSISQIDRDLIISLLKYPKIVLEAANNYAPNILAEYLFEISSKFNNFYEHESLGEAMGSEKSLRIAISELVTRVIKRGLTVLGIKVLERM